MMLLLPGDGNQREPERRKWIEWAEWAALSCTAQPNLPFRVTFIAVTRYMLVPLPGLQSLHKRAKLLFDPE